MDKNDISFVNSWHTKLLKVKPLQMNKDLDEQVTKLQPLKLSGLRSIAPYIFIEVELGPPIE